VTAGTRRNGVRTYQIESIGSSQVIESSTEPGIGSVAGDAIGAKSRAVVVVELDLMARNAIVLICR